MKDIEYINLPKIPEEIIESIEQIIQKPKKAESSVPNDYHYFQTRNVNKDLQKYIESIFTFPVFSQYQIIYNGLPIHIDKGNRILAYNYILQQGGENVYTNIYLPNHQIIQSEKIVPYSWHKINTGKLHGVHGIKTVRVGISVTPI